MPTVLAYDPVPVSDPRDLFDPPLYSDAELAWLAEHVGQVPVIAFKDHLPPGVNVKAVRPLLERLEELKQLEQHEHELWCGIAAVKKAIETYQHWSRKWAAAYKRSKRNPRFPSTFYIDHGNRAYRYGVGSDAGRVRTYEDSETGERKYFAIALNVPSGQESEIEAERPVVPTVSKDLAVRFIVDEDNGVMACPVCKFSVNVKTDSGQRRNMARIHLHKHLKSATSEPDWHRAVLNEEFS